MSDNQDARWIKAFRMQAGVLQELDEATMRRVRKILRMEKAAHVVPVGLIQLTDFASDIMVIVQIATTAGGAGADWIVCVVAVGLSLLVAWVGLTGEGGLSLREQLIACVLACGEGYYADDARVCHPCHGSCKACTGPRSSDCSSCVSNVDESLRHDSKRSLPVPAAYEGSGTKPL